MNEIEEQNSSKGSSSDPRNLRLWDNCHARTNEVVVHTKPFHGNMYLDVPKAARIRDWLTEWLKEQADEEPKDSGKGRCEMKFPSKMEPGLSLEVTFYDGGIRFEMPTGPRTRTLSLDDATGLANRLHDMIVDIQERIAAKEREAAAAQERAAKEQADKERAEREAKEAREEQERQKASEAHKDYRLGYKVVRRNDGELTSLVGHRAQVVYDEAGGAWTHRRPACGPFCVYTDLDKACHCMDHQKSSPQWSEEHHNQVLEIWAVVYLPSSEQHIYDGTDRRTLKDWCWCYDGIVLADKVRLIERVQ